MTQDHSLIFNDISIVNRFKNIRKYSENQCKPLKIEDYIPQPVVYISPPKWHLGHTTWFFEEFILKNFYHGYSVFDGDFSFLFNSYYNTVGDRVLRANRGNLTRPSVDYVYEYRSYVDKHMTRLLENADRKVLELVELGLNHEQQHQELFYTDLKFILGHNPLFPVYKEGFDLTKAKDQDKEYIAISEGIYEIGHHGDGFHYDNELGRHKVFLHDYKLSKALVTNGEFIDFINDEAYQRFDLWLDEGWSWVNENNILAPRYWHKIEGKWHHYTLSGLKPVNHTDVLCHISYYEAAAFAEWSGMRLPSEFEWEIASKYLTWGERWEWTSSAYSAYPGFAAPHGAVGEYNGKFMVNQMVLRGASAATSPGHSRHTYRNFFHPNYQWQFSGIRLAKKHQL